MKTLEQTKLKILAKAGTDEIANVYIAEINGKRLEFVESIQPPITREKKWVLIISSLFGCPVKCNFCDAGGYYQGKLSKGELLAQIDFLIKQRFPDKNVNCEKFKIQFARVGEPSLNENVLDVLEELPTLYNVQGFIPSISTVAPYGTELFFERLLEIKNRIYKENFQLQFSIHTMDREKRQELIPIKKWSFEQINEYGKKFYKKGERKITLNFAINNQEAINIKELKKSFDPEIFLIKITPINPTHKAISNRLASVLDVEKLKTGLIKELEEAGFEAIISIGELEENNIGSNCGQYISNLEQKAKNAISSYSYELQEV